MKPRIRIRPRIWLTAPKPLARLGWVPLSLVFRKQRLFEESAQSAVGSHVSLFNVLSFLSQIRHYHTNESRQIFTRSIQHLHFFFNRVAAQGPAPTRGSGASVFHELRRERSVETLLRVWTLLESRQSFTATRHLREITKQVAYGRAPHTWSEAPAAIPATPAHRLLATPELFRPGLFNPASPLSLRQQEMPGAIRRQTLEAVLEDRLAPRLRKADPPSVPVFPASTVPTVQQIWRQLQNTSRESSGETRRLPAGAQTVTADLPAQHRADLLPPPSASTVPPGKVEVPTVERIAEDVMKRIERHLRIERERRGI